MFAVGSGKYWWCNSFKAHYFHMWWACQEIYQFGVELNKCIENITLVKLPMEPATMLLDFEYGGVLVFKGVLGHMLTATTLLIAK